ncbi:hypothetical protein K469DRAFT_689181 [Zopfia rhizophila CBS 207.26]|uniref:Heterokaryon incompatibility domain-containing protein n=1 Tax=Zopfia rhizophila CBS 207.26 TaxID=1314779 RepID=A0A6A6ET25_9PEZI|nr:hypothetical protein K469DRAFT_689181 [Zopfia rhizophila CBS 207.26]
MLSWDCIAATASEQVPKMQKSSYNAGLKRTFHDLLSDPDEDILEEPRRSRSDWINSWWKLVGEYNACSLTFATDKWPAISGLATEVEIDRGQRLVHGLWAHNLTDELLWTISMPKKKSLDIGAPSWSWLSIDGRVHRRRYNYNIDFRLDATSTLPRQAPHTDPTESESESQTSNNVLKIRARMLPPKWVIRAQIVTIDEYQVKRRVGLVVLPVDAEKEVWRKVGFFEFSWRNESHCDASVRKR